MTPFAVILQRIALQIRNNRYMDLVKGDIVNVWAAGQPARKARATVLIVSSNQRSIAVAFEDKPPFQIHDGWVIHREHGLTMFAGRDEPAGPWREMLQDRQFEIELVKMDT
jgi:hypothetical protein